MNAFQTNSKMCRFCLNINQEQLFAATEILDSALTIEIIQLFTGVQLKTTNNISFAICGTCRDVLKAWLEFRNICLNNDAVFKQSVSINTSPISDKLPENGLQLQRRDMNLFQVEIILPCEEIVGRNDINQSSIDALASDDSESEQIIEEPRRETLANGHELVTCSSSAEEMEVETRFEYTANDEHEEKHCDYMRTCPNLDDEAQHNVQLSLVKTEKSSETETNRKRQLCVTCGKLVKNLWYHIGTHANDIASHACPHCPMKMKNQSNLARHIQAVHLKKVVKSCEPCGRGFSHINSYKAHMRSRHGVGETYQCQSCLKTFKQPSGYKKHVSQAHSNERNFVCSICSKPFKDKQALNLHKNVHSTERPYVCGMCPKQFKGASAKRTHELTHVGVVFKCTLCDKSYQYKSLLNLHVKKTHPEGV